MGSRVATGSIRSRCGVVLAPQGAISNAARRSCVIASAVGTFHEVGFLHEVGSVHRVDTVHEVETVSGARGNQPVDNVTINTARRENSQSPSGTPSSRSSPGDCLANNLTVGYHLMR
jgi:hypothetical protein